MDEKNNETNYGIKGFLKYISTVVSWTIFVLLVILGVLLIYYFISVRLFSSKGEKYEPFFSIYSVQSGSMEPTISYQDVIVNVKVKSIDDVKINDVITFISAWQVNYGMTMTHRVVDKKTTDDGRTCLVTRGDSNTNEDQTCVTEENLVGVVKAVVPGLGKIKAFLSSALGWFLIVIIPALYVIIKDVIKIFNLTMGKDEEYIKEKKPSKEENKKKETEKVKKEELDDDLEARLEKAYQDLEKVRKK